MSHPHSQSSSSQSPPRRAEWPEWRRPPSDPDPVATTARLKALAREAKSSRVPFDNDSSEHDSILRRAISNVLSTELALCTYAQIIDGLPIADVAWDRRSPCLMGIHPIEEHEDLCPGVLDRARQFQQDFDPSILSFDPQALRSFREALPGSRLFTTRLFELVAVAMHEIGSLLFQLGLRMHRGDIEAVDQWKEDGPDAFCRPTLFSHHGYLDDDVYPDGVADIVGYWAEDRVLGGVMVFDRQSEQRAPQSPPNVYFNSCRPKVTYRYYQLRDDQQQALLDFLVAENPDPSQSPLPILADARNAVRVDEERAVLRHFYRDEWERKPPTKGYIDHHIGRPRNTVDYPEYQGFVNHLNTLPTATIGVPSSFRPGEALSYKIDDEEVGTAEQEGGGSDPHGPGDAT